MSPNGNADLTRSLILKSATDIISTDGLAALTAGRLISQAGISKGGLYHHFKTMHQVENEVLERLIENFLIKMSAYPKPELAQGLLDLIEQEVFECFAANERVSRALYAYISEAANNSDVRLLLRKMTDDLAVMRLKQLTDLYPCADTVCLNNAVQVILSIQMGLMARSFLSNDRNSFEHDWRSCKTLFEDLFRAMEHKLFKQNIPDKNQDSAHSQMA